MKRNIFITTLLVFLHLYNARCQVFSIPDTNFSKCLRSDFPSVINNKGQLILSEAAKVKGTLNCSSLSIKSVDGLQHFIGLTSINLEKNNLRYVPSISLLKNLQEIIVADNELDTFPSLKGLKRLKIIYAHRNRLKEFPELTDNDSLNVLYIHTNQFDTIPYLGHLKQLITLHLTNNHLKHLPNIDKLVSLQNLNCWSNDLKDIPSLAQLKDLQVIDVSYNNLIKIPELGVKPNLSIAFFNNNNISSLVDFGLCTKLENVRLYKNPLTFKEITKVKNVTGFDTLFKFMPNDAVRVGKRSEVNQYTTLNISTGVDNKVPEMIYEWYQNGKMLVSGSKDTLTINKVQLSDAGKYTCVVKNSAFSNVSLRTDTFNIKVIPCFDPASLSLVSTEISCLSEGSVIVNAVSTNTVTYDLITQTGSKTFISKSGKFEGLSETQFKLKIQVKDGCSYSHPESIAIPQKECEEVLISPDNDGTADSHYFSDTGKVIIYDKRGNIIKSMTIPGEWDGSSDKGQVYTGFYVADINNGKKLIGITVLY